MISKISVTSAATLISSAKKRRWFIIQNASDADIYFAFTGDSSLVTVLSGDYPGLKLAPGAVFIQDGTDVTRSEASYANDGAIYAVTATGTKTVVVHEG